MINSYSSYANETTYNRRFPYIQVQRVAKPLQLYTIRACAKDCVSNALLRAESVKSCSKRGVSTRWYKECSQRYFRRPPCVRLGLGPLRGAPSPSGSIDRMGSGQPPGSPSFGQGYSRACENATTLLAFSPRSHQYSWQVHGYGSIPVLASTIVTRNVSCSQLRYSPLSPEISYTRISTPN